MLKALSSSLGKKLLMSLTGFGLIVFVVLHLLGNLSLYQADGSAFNAYADMLDRLGNLKLVAELGLVALFGAHVVLALGLKANHLHARPTRYKMARSKGGHTLSNVSSRNMIITGTVLLGFLILHIIQFRFGPAESAGYLTQVHGPMGPHDARDLFRLVHETFANPLYVGIYVFAMLMLGFHLRHGFWSAFQSLGAMNSRLTGPVYALGVLTAIVLAAGFLFIPVWMYCGGLQ